MCHAAMTKMKAEATEQKAIGGAATHCRKIDKIKFQIRYVVERLIKGGFTQPRTSLFVGSLYRVVHLVQDNILLTLN